MSQPSINAIPVRLRQSAPPGSAEYSRKDKSLGLLCESFVQVYGQHDEQQICLDAAAATLGVERRRIYDIVNVLESVGIVLRKAKNSYAWKGFTQIDSKLEDLRRKARSDLYGGPEDFRTPTASRKPSKKISRKLELPNAPLNSSAETEPDPDLEQASTMLTYKPGSRKEKSLGVLSQRFVQLFLLAGATAVSLDQAAVQLLGRSPNDADPLSASPVDGDASKLLKTKVRRLYDIANILSSLRLIEKVHTLNRKPAFKWLGSACSEAAVESIRKQGAKRLATADERPRTAVKRRRLFDAGTGENMLNVSPVTVDGTSMEREVTAPLSDVQGTDGSQGQDNRNSGLDRTGFDPETTAQLENVFKTFPEAYASRWREYVNLVNAMLTRGQVSRQKAYDSVSNVLRQAKLAKASKVEARTATTSMVTTTSTGSKPPEAKSEDHLADGPQNCQPVSPIENTRPLHSERKPMPEGLPGATNVTTPSTQANGDSHSSASAAAATAAAEAAEAAEAAAAAAAAAAAEASAAAEKQLKLPNSKPEETKLPSGTDTVDSTSVERASGQPVTQVGVGVMKAAMMGGTKVDVATPWSADFIENYMRRSRDAGPEHLKAAQEWLQRLRQWQKMTAPLQAVMRNMGMTAGGPAPSVSLVQGGVVAEDSRVSTSLPVGRDV